MKITRELKTGVVAVLVIALFIWGYNFMKGLNVFDGPLKTYYTEYPNVQGLNTASVVTINGVDVGKVISINFNKNPDKKGQLIVEFSVENDFEFSKNSVAKIYSASLMGGKSLAVIPSYEGDIAAPGDVLKGEIESDIFEGVINITGKINSDIDRIDGENNKVYLEQGKVLSYDFLIVATGTQTHPEETPGLMEELFL